MASYIDADGTERLRLLPTWKEAFQMLFTFSLVVLGWIIFRSETISQAWEYISKILSTSLFSIPHLINRDFYIPTIMAIILMLECEWLMRKYTHGLEISKKNFYVKNLIYFILLFCIFAWGGHTENFIYFQF